MQTAATRPSSLEAGADSPDWSPDGRKISFIREFREDQRRMLVTMNADGSHRQAVTAAQGVPAWQPRENRHG